MTANGEGAGPEEAELARSEDERGYWLPEGYEAPVSDPPAPSRTPVGAIAIVVSVLAIGGIVAAALAGGRGMLIDQSKVLLARGDALHAQLLAGAKVGDAVGTAVAKNVDLFAGYSGVGGATSVARCADALGLDADALPGTETASGHAIARGPVQSFCDGCEVCYVVSYACCGEPSTVLAVPRDDALIERLRAELAGATTPRLAVREEALFLIWGDHDLDALSERLGEAP